MRTAKKNQGKVLNKAEVENRWLSRRQFLVGASQAMLTLPPLLSLMSEKAMAQATARPVVRYIGMMGHLGIDPHQMFPVDQTDLAMVAGQRSLGYKPLGNFGTPISRVIGSEFTDLYPYMNLIQGLSLTGGLYQGHNNSVLSGTHSGGREPIYGKSIDVILEKSASVYGSSFSGKKAVRVMDHDHLKGFTFDRVDGNRIIMSAVQGDLALFNLLLGQLASSGSPASGPTQQQSRQKLVVDRVFTDLKAIEKSTRLSKSDRELLDRYISGITDLQKSVVSNAVPTNPSCSKPTVALEVDGTGNYWYFPSDAKWGVQSVDKLYDNYIEIFRMAALCDLTRVMQWAYSYWDHSLVAGGTAGGLHHEAPSSEIQADRQKFGILKLGKLARAFRSTPDPINGGNLLDNSIIIYANELGAWTTAHNTFSIPTITFGGGGGKIRTGNFIDCRQRPLKPLKGYHPGRPYKQFLQAVMASMGVTKAEYSQFGDGKGFGEFKPGINQFGLVGDYFSAYENEHNEPLPFLFKG